MGKISKNEPKNQQYLFMYGKNSQFTSEPTILLLGGSDKKHRKLKCGMTMQNKEKLIFILLNGRRWRITEKQEN